MLRRLAEADGAWRKGEEWDPALACLCATGVGSLTGIGPGRLWGPRQGVEGTPGTSGPAGIPPEWHFTTAKFFWLAIASQGQTRIQQRNGCIHLDKNSLFLQAISTENSPSKYGYTLILHLEVPLSRLNYLLTESKLNQMLVIFYLWNAQKKNNHSAIDTNNLKGQMVAHKPNPSLWKAVQDGLSQWKDMDVGTAEVVNVYPSCTNSDSRRGSASLNVPP